MNDVMSLIPIEEVTLHDIYASTASHTMRLLEFSSTCNNCGVLGFWASWALTPIVIEDAY